MRTVLIFAALAEFATGVALLIAPSIIVQLLLGQNLVGVAVQIARLTGIALVALAIACWPGPAWAGMLTYSTGVTVFLGYAAYTAGATGSVGLHGALTAAVLWSFAKGI